VFQFDTLMNTLEKFSKEFDVKAGTYTARGIYSVYMPDWQYLLHVWLPEVSTA